MSFESAKCPNCGASINVDPSLEKAFCMSCGSALVPKEAIQLRKVDAIVDGISTIQNTLVRGQQCLEAQDWEAATRVFGSVIDNQADNYMAWNGLLKTLTQNFTQNDVTTIKSDGEKGLVSVLRNCSRHVPPEAQVELNEQKAILLEMWNATIQQLESESSKKSNQTIIGAIIIFFMPIIFLYFFLGPSGIAMTIAFIGGLIASLLTFFGLNAENADLTRRVEQMREIISRLDLSNKG